MNHRFGAKPFVKISADLCRNRRRDRTDDAKDQNLHDLPAQHQPGINAAARIKRIQRITVKHGSDQEIQKRLAAPRTVQGFFEVCHGLTYPALSVGSPGFAHPGKERDHENGKPYRNKRADCAKILAFFRVEAKGRREPCYGGAVPFVHKQDKHDEEAKNTAPIPDGRPISGYFANFFFRSKAWQNRIHKDQHEFRRDEGQIETEQNKIDVAARRVSIPKRPGERQIEHGKQPDPPHSTPRAVCIGANQRCGERDQQSGNGLTPEPSRLRGCFGRFRIRVDGREIGKGNAGKIGSKNKREAQRIKRLRRPIECHPATNPLLEADL